MCRRLRCQYWSCGRGSAAFGRLMAAAPPRLPNECTVISPVMPEGDDHRRIWANLRVHLLSQRKGPMAMSPMSWGVWVGVPHLRPTATRNAPPFGIPFLGGDPRPRGRRGRDARGLGQRRCAEGGLARSHPIENAFFRCLGTSNVHNTPPKQTKTSAHSGLRLGPNQKTRRRIRRTHSRSRIRITPEPSPNVKRIRRVWSELWLRIRVRQCGPRPEGKYRPVHSLSPYAPAPPPPPHTQTRPSRRAVSVCSPPPHPPPSPGSRMTCIVDCGHTPNVRDIPLQRGWHAKHPRAERYLEQILEQRGAQGVDPDFRSRCLAPPPFMFRTHANGHLVPLSHFHDLVHPNSGRRPLAPPRHMSPALALGAGLSLRTRTFFFLVKDRP